jgi:lysozyme
MKINAISRQGLELVKQFEGFKAKPYLCPAMVPTIGYGTTRYPDGKKVSLADAPIDKDTAESYLLNDIVFFSEAVDNYVRDDINQNQFDALVSFAYNVGPHALLNSTLLKRVNQNPGDTNIRAQFMRWVKGGGRTLQGLVRRRQAEADLYFKNI